jgi:hypothetical protein
VAAKFHEQNFEVFLRIEKKTHRKGVDQIEEETIVFDLDSKQYRTCCDQDSVPGEPWTFPDIPQEVSIKKIAPCCQIVTFLFVTSV